MRRTSLAALVFAAAASCGLSAAPVASTASAQTQQVVETSQSRLIVPFDFDVGSLRKVGAVAVDLWVSVDGGAFRREASVETTARQFVYDADGAGEYAFCVRVRDAQGRRIPAGPMTPGMTVRVNETARPSAANAAMSLDAPRGDRRTTRIDRPVTFVDAPPVEEAPRRPRDEAPRRPSIAAASLPPVAYSDGPAARPPRPAAVSARTVSLSAPTMPQVDGAFAAPDPAP